MSYPKQPGDDAEAHLRTTMRCMELSAELAGCRARVELAVKALASLQAATDAKIAQLRQDRYDALSVYSTDGLLSSEWVARTGKAERELAQLRAELDELKAKLGRVVEVLREAQRNEVMIGTGGMYVGASYIARVLAELEQAQ